MFVCKTTLNFIVNYCSHSKIVKKLLIINHSVVGQSTIKSRDVFWVINCVGFILFLIVASVFSKLFILIKLETYIIIIICYPWLITVHFNKVDKKLMCIINFFLKCTQTYFPHFVLTITLTYLFTLHT